MQQCTVCGSAMAPGETICHHCGRAHYGPVCAQCQQPAPTLVRGGKVICSGCGATRGPLAGVPLNLAGEGHRVGGVVTSVLAWTVLLGGLLVGGLVGLVVSLLAAFFAASVWWGVVAGLLLGGAAGGAGALLMKGSQQLKGRGQEIRDEAYEQSILAMAATRRGSVTTVEVSQQLGIALAEADRLLGIMSQKGRALVEINREGLLQYTFKDLPGALVPQTAVGVATTGVRVDVANASPAETAKAEVDREFQAMTERHRGGGL